MEGQRTHTHERIAFTKVIQKIHKLWFFGLNRDVLDLLYEKLIGLGARLDGVQDLHAGLSGLRLNCTEEMNDLILGRHILAFTLQFGYASEVFWLLIDFFLEHFQRSLRFGFPFFHFAQIGKVRNDKPQVQQNNDHRANAHNEAFLHRTKIVPIAVHWTSERLSSTENPHAMAPFGALR